VVESYGLLITSHYCELENNGTDIKQQNKTNKNTHRAQSSAKANPVWICSPDLEWAELEGLEIEGLEYDGRSRRGGIFAGLENGGNIAGVEIAGLDNGRLELADWNLADWKKTDCTSDATE